MEKKQIDEYVLEKLLGEGSFGSVYYTTKLNSNEIYATKVIPKRLLNQGRSYEFFKREVEILKKIEHKNINKLYAEKETNNNHYLILEYCNGGDLYKISNLYKKRNGRPLPEEFVQYYVKQICEALHYLHSQGIIHRDLKLENILVSFNSERDRNELNIQESKIKLIDFGLARTIDQNNLASSICGSPIIMDPQLLSKLHKEAKDFQYNGKSDIWALGTITYELLVGSLPFNAANYDELLLKINKGQYNIPENLKLSLESIGFLNGLLQYEQKNRLEWNDILKHGFLKKNVKDFTKLDLKKIDNKFKSPNELKLNTMDKNNFLWVLYKNDNIQDLSRVTEINNKNKEVVNNNSNNLNPIHIKNQSLKNNNNQGVIPINNPVNYNNSNEVKVVENISFKQGNTAFNKNQPNVIANKNNYIEKKPDNDDFDFDKAFYESPVNNFQDPKKNMEEFKMKEKNEIKLNYETPDGSDDNYAKNNNTIKNNININNNNFFDLKNFVDLPSIESI